MIDRSWRKMRLGDLDFDCQGLGFRVLGLRVANLTGVQS